MQLKLAQAQAADRLRERALPNPSRDAELLLQHALGRDRAYLLAHPELILSCRELTRYDDLLKQRAMGKPIQYITGHQEFWGLDLMVTPDVLIPRPETEHVVETALDLLKSGAVPPASPVIGSSVIDVGTGSGAIALALASAIPDLTLLASDISEPALVVARGNAAALDFAGRVEFVHGDLLGPFLPERTSSHPLSPVPCLPFGMIVSNPPYVADEDDSIERQVRDYEPSVALFAGPTGNEVYRRLIPQAFELLSPAGWLVLEIGPQNEAGVTELLRDWKRVQIKADLRGLPRVVLAQKPE